MLTLLATSENRKLMKDFSDLEYLTPLSFTKNTTV